MTYHETYSLKQENNMTHQIYCQKLNKQDEGLTQPPFPGELGQKIYDNISQQAWQMWLDHQTKLINEYRLSTLEPNSREFLIAEMKKFLLDE